MKSLTMTKAKQSRRTGFTLIELLVVIAIIAILAAILFPVFARARENARRASCQSNLKQVGLGILQYTQDYDERYPLRNNNGVSWRQRVQPYIKSTQIFVCPSNTRVSAAENDAVTSDFPRTRDGYAINWRIPDAGTESAVNTTSTKIMVGERISSWNNFGMGWVDWGESGNNGFLNEGFAGHLGTANYLFADGHVKALRPSQTSAPLNMWGRWQNGPTTCSTAAGQYINCDDVYPSATENLGKLEAANS
jgi:prepilin-type N-terminal cleavage/methylation domain-containing protein/prepilin-type processing-associated H-X9-DG protein